jgi:anti-anti-sigma factor
MLRIDIQSDSRTATLRCSGRVVFGMETEILRSMVQSRPERNLNVDLAQVETVDASGLGVLVELQHWAIEGGRILRFTNASDFVARLVALTRLHCVLHIPMISDDDCAQLASAGAHHLRRPATRSAAQR